MVGEIIPECRATSVGISTPLMFGVYVVEKRFVYNFSSGKYWSLSSRMEKLERADFLNPASWGAAARKGT